MVSAGFESILRTLSKALHMSQGPPYPHFTAEIIEANPRLTVRLRLARVRMNHS